MSQSDGVAYVNLMKELSNSEILGTIEMVDLVKKRVPEAGMHQRNPSISGVGY